MFGTERTSVKTPWAELNEMFNGDGIPGAGLCLMPQWDKEASQQLVAKLFAHQYLEVRDRIPSNNRRVYMPGYLTVGCPEDSILEKLAAHLNVREGDLVSSDMNYHLARMFNMKNMCFQQLGPNTPSTSAVAEIAKSCKDNNITLRVLYIPTLEDTQHLDITLSKIRLEAIKHNCLIIVGTILVRNVVKEISEGKVTAEDAIHEYKNMVMLERQYAQADYVIHVAGVGDTSIKVVRGKFRSALTPLNDTALLDL